MLLGALNDVNLVKCGGVRGMVASSDTTEGAATSDPGKRKRENDFDAKLFLFDTLSLIH